MTTDTSIFAHAFKCGHVEINEAIHDATWGARLIYKEVEQGGGGIVWNRQTPTGDPDLLRAKVFPVVDRAMAAIRDVLGGWKYGFSGESERGHIEYREGLVVVVASPQSSYGYLYITAVLEKAEHFGETVIWSDIEMNANAKDHATVVGNTEPYRSKMRKPLEEEKKDAERDLDRLGYARGQKTVKDAEAALKAFDKLWPKVPTSGPRKPAAVFVFPEVRGRKGYDRPSWLAGIFESRDACKEAGLHPAFQSDTPDDPDPSIVFLTPGLLWDGASMFGESYTHGGETIVTNFLIPSDDDEVMSGAVWEVYDERYVEPLAIAAEKAGATRA